MSLHDQNDCCIGRSDLQAGDGKSLLKRRGNVNMKIKDVQDVMYKYDELKKAFSGFLDQFNERLNKNDQFRSSITISDDKTNAVLYALGQSFRVSFYMARVNDKILGVLESATIEPRKDKDDVFLWRAYFDTLGNVKSTPEATSSFHTIQDPAFLGVLLGETVNRYFTMLENRLKMESPVIEPERL